MPVTTIILGQIYNGGPYGSSTYQNGTNTSTATSGSGSGSTNSTGGTLTNTGFDLILAGSVAAAIIAAAIVVRVWHRPAKSKS